MTPGITCRQAVTYISKREEKSLSRTARFKLWQHLGECSLCRTFNSHNNIIQKAYKSSKPIAHLNPEEKDKIIETVLKRSPGR